MHRPIGDKPARGCRHRKNALPSLEADPALCTFASPAVGDSSFATAFNGLGLPSWRVVNAPDLVPKLPPQILSFTHVNSLLARVSHLSQSDRSNVVAQSILSATNDGKWCSGCCRGAVHSSDYYLVCSRRPRHREHHSKRRRKPVGSASRISVAIRKGSCQAKVHDGHREGRQTVS
jgi:hypothetical protein